MKMDLDQRIVGDVYRWDAWLVTGAARQVGRAEAVEQAPETENPEIADPAAETPAAEDPATENPATEDPATEALAAIASGYEDARARIISGPSSPAVGRHRHESAPVPGLLAPAPTVPLTLPSSLKRDRPPQERPAAERRAATGIWSRILRHLDPGGPPTPNR